MEAHWKGIQFTRYADDIVCHCRSEAEAQALKASLTERFAQCGLTLHPEKTRIVYCKSWKNQADYEHIGFDFLGFMFRPRLTKCRGGILLPCFLPAISPKAAQRLRDEIRAWPWLAWTQGELRDIVIHVQSKLRGWIKYYGKYGRGTLRQVLFQVDRKLSAWVLRKYKKVKTRAQAVRRVEAIKAGSPSLFAHWV